MSKHDASRHGVPRDRQPCPGHIRVQVSLLRSAAHCAVIDNMLVTLSAEMHYALLHT